MIALLLLMLAQNAPSSETTGRVFPAKQLTCTVTTPDSATFTVTVMENNGVARVKSTREELFPSGVFVVAPAYISRSEGGKPVDYRVSISGDRPTGQYSIGMKVEGGVPVQVWLRIMPPGPYRSDRSREIGSAQCTAEKNS
jgi:hypothetical protein